MKDQLATDSFVEALDSLSAEDRVHEGYKHHNGKYKMVN